MSVFSDCMQAAGLPAPMLDNLAELIHWLEQLKDALGECQRK